MKLFAMPSQSASASEPPEEGIDEGGPADEAEARSVQPSSTSFAPKTHSAKSARRRAQWRRLPRKGGQKRLETKSFGDHIVADHIVVKSQRGGRCHR